MQRVRELEMAVLEGGVGAAASDRGALNFPVIISFGDGRTASVVQVESGRVHAGNDTFVDDDAGAGRRASDRCLARFDLAGLSVVV